MEKITNNSQKITVHDIILDYGCGTGLFWEYLKNKEILVDWRGKFLGIDISVEMLKAFREKHLISYFKYPQISNLKEGDKEGDKEGENCNHEELTENINLLCCDGENLPFREKLMDFIYAFTSLQNLDNIEQGLKEIFKIKKKIPELV